MKERSDRYLLLIILFIFVFLLMLNTSIYEKIEDINGYIGYNKVILQMKDDTKLENGLRISEAEILKSNIESGTSIYYSTDKTRVFSEDVEAMARVCGINGAYNQFYNINLKRGSFIMSDENMVVIEDDIARELFRTTNVVGMEIEIYGRKFTIIGVTSRDKSIISRIFDDDLPRIYIPIQIMKDELNEKFIVTNFEVKTYSNSLPEKNEDFFKKQLEFLSKKTDEYYIKDYGAIKLAVKQRNRIILFILGLFLIYKLFIFTKFLIKKLEKNVIEELKYNYVLDAFKNRNKELVVELLKIVAAILGIVFIWKEIIFSLYIPPEKFPENPVNLLQIIEVFKINIREFLTTQDLYAMAETRETSFLQRISEINFYIGFICSCILINALNKIKHIFDNGIEAFERISLCLILAIALSLTIIFVLGFIPKLVLKNIVIIWICIFGVIITDYKESIIYS